MFFSKLYVVCVMLITTAIANETFESSTEVSYPTPGPINCGGNITEWYGDFSSPNYPFNYPNDADCVWIITSPNWEPYISLYFWQFVTEANYDFLEVRAGPDQNSPLIQGMTGTLPAGEMIESNSRYLWVWFHSDGSGMASGFTASFHVGTAATTEPTTPADPYEPSTLETSSPPTPGCSHSYTNTWGTFNSPEFPFYYPFNSECEWRFSAPPGFRVHITLAQQLSLEHDRECAYDHLEFRDGPSPNSPLITRICGYHEEPLAITSSSNSLYARFHSDDQFNAQGFVGIYQTRQIQKLELEKRKEKN